jgi:ribulose-5-phosphate 4-epimerase/fuculose-1-phosphate aldolase
MAMTDDTRTDVPAIGGVALTPKDLTFPMQETFESVEAERTHRKGKLAGALRIFGRLGFGEGVAGHITVRDPEFPDHFWVNPFGMSFRHIRSSDLLLVNHQGEVVIGSQPVNRAAFVLHAAIHHARPDVIAAAHAHSVHGKAFSSLGIPIAPITQDACVFYGDHTKFPTGKLAIHQNHGLFTVGSTVDEAAFWFITGERTCQAQLLAMAAGTPHEIRHEYAHYTLEQTGFPLAGWFSFQPLWQEICRTDPDLFD